MRVRAALDMAFVAVGIILCVLLIRREFGSTGPAGGQVRHSLTPLSRDQVAALDSLAFRGPRHRLRRDAVQMYVLFDVECPFCKRFHTDVREIERRFESTIQVSYVHFPLSQHRFARPGALALECAGEEGRFNEMLDIVYASQDSLGLIT